MGALRRKRLADGAAADKKVSITTLRMILGDDCLYCGRTLSFGDRRATSATIDHVVPVWRGGAHTFGNVVLSCKSCNSRKHTKPLERWFEEMRGLGFDVHWTAFVLGEIASVAASALRNSPKL